MYIYIYIYIYIHVCIYADLLVTLHQPASIYQPLYTLKEYSVVFLQSQYQRVQVELPIIIGKAKFQNGVLYLRYREYKGNVQNCFKAFKFYFTGVANISFISHNSIMKSILHTKMQKRMLFKYIRTSLIHIVGILKYAIRRFSKY